MNADSRRDVPTGFHGGGGARGEVDAGATEAAVALVAVLLDRAHATGQFPTFQDLALEDALDIRVSEELESLGAIAWLAPPIGPYHDIARRTLVLTRNAVRLLREDRAARELAAVAAVRDEIVARFRRARQPQWTSLEELARAIGQTRESCAVALVLYLADPLNRHHLSPYGGCPHEIEIDFTLASTNLSVATSELELLTSAQSYALRAETQATAGPDHVDKPDAAGSMQVSRVSPEPGRRGRGKGGRLSTTELLAPYESEYKRRWELGEFATATEARKQLQAVINREGDRVLVAGDDGFKNSADIRLRTRTWFPRARRGCRATKPDNDRGSV